jgi:hypothetical protein
MLAELNVKDFPNSWPKLTSTSATDAKVGSR